MHAVFLHPYSKQSAILRITFHPKHQAALYSELHRRLTSAHWAVDPCATVMLSQFSMSVDFIRESPTNPGGGWTDAERKAFLKDAHHALKSIGIHHATHRPMSLADRL